MRNINLIDRYANIEKTGSDQATLLWFTNSGVRMLASEVRKDCARLETIRNALL